MRRSLAILAGLLALVGSVHVLREATQNRPDPVIEGSVTTVDFSVATHRYPRGEGAAATTLWAVCSSTVGGEVSPSPEATGADRWRVTIRPAVGDHGEQRLVGCLEDVTIDRVVGHVVALRHDVP